MEKFEWTSEAKTEDIVKRTDGVSITARHLEFSTENPDELMKLQEAFEDVQCNYLNYQAEAIEEEWFDFTVPQQDGSGSIEVNVEGAKNYFNKFAREVLDCLYALDETAWEIFKYVKKETRFEPDYDCDDHMAYGLFGN